jgi:quercetin dioxygenase-like cupin family protein
MKRHPALAHLSRDHHHTLVWARRLKRGDSDGFDEYRRGLARHFREEEERVFPLLAEFCAEPPPVLARALVDHARIRAARAGPELGALLEAHVRLEERELFELLQEVVPDERLAALVAAPRRGGPEWGTESEELNATILAWPPGAGPPEHVNETRDVALVVLEGDGELELDGARSTVAAGEVVVLPKGSRRRVTAGPDGIRYATVHRRRGGLQLGRFDRT